MITTRCRACHAEITPTPDEIRTGPATWQYCEACRATPRVTAVATWSARSKVWILTITCPYCGKRHTHGGGSDAEPDYGSRAPHCLERGHPDYELVPAAGEEAAA
jgi:hypothetical protein